MHRRDFLRSTAAITALLGLPLGAAAASASNRRFIFVFANGGWDPTRVLAPVFGTAAGMEAEAVATTIGGLPLVDHPDRPTVRAFFETHASQAAILNGMLVPSVAHEQCTKLLMTGSSDDGKPDWASVLAHEGDGYLLPHLVGSGPAFAGPLGTDVVRTGLYGQLAGLVQGPAGGLSSASSAAVDRLLLQRSAARQQVARPGLETEMTGAFHSALGQLEDMRALQGQLNLSTDGSFTTQLHLAVDAVATGTSRCVTISHGAWDTHTDNDAQQSVLWEDLFAGLTTLADTLAARGADRDTTVVVLSEMGRTPTLNEDLGKDHWPYSSVLLFGDGIAGGQSVGGYDEAYQGRNIDPSSGAVLDSGRELSTSVLGATLMALADVDPGDWVPGVPALTGLIA